MAVSAVIHKSRLQRRFNTRDTRQIDVGFDGTTVCRLVVDLFYATVDYNHDPGLVTPGRVDKHFLAHHVS